ncbi:phage Mu protein F like protein [Novosphingobium sp. PhB165]|uniref:phage minor head protein n=1 Tax=Novosphingobium sp. PhB165 TaxID=2485105 RepID=UPI00104A6202|nr:phage minor head protein [Novosphingobium sp. PhB165]TCM21486.1 phage Mu protein F like protein [Novosphingobium sp. PhB165]
MVAFNLVTMARQKGIRRNVTVRPIQPTQANADDLAALYLAVLKPWSANAILAGYDQPAKGVSDSLTLDAPSDQTQAIAEAQRESTRLIGEFTAGLSRWAVRIEQWHRKKWIAAVDAATDIDLTPILTDGDTAETLAVFIDRNVALVSDVTAQVRGRIADAVYRGYQERLPAREVAKSISDATGLARARSIRIASDQNSKISAALDRVRRDQAGVALFKYRHSGKLHARPWHKARDGKIYDSATGKQVDTDGSAMSGGDVIAADDRPGMPPFCGCREQAYLAMMAESQN